MPNPELSPDPDVDEARELQPVRFFDDPRLVTQGLADFSPKQSPADVDVEGQAEAERPTEPRTLSGMKIKKERHKSPKSEEAGDPDQDSQNPDQDQDQDSQNPDQDSQDQEQDSQPVIAPVPDPEPETDESPTTEEPDSEPPTQTDSQLPWSEPDSDKDTPTS